MRDTVVKVEHLSKVYRLGAIGTGSLRQDVKYWWNKSVLKKEDPFFSLSKDEYADTNNILHALTDVSFEVKQGEALGIIGSNGSGKSTLLKIISRIVRPTKGIVRGKGKISSLLEVGTGFQQELSGRENIYNSGYALGMSKSEIKQKFDEIVEFSGVERFIDTPVKRYSSGMYVRLAFAVAAHLEPDILIVDEVLAVGDADFQKKCLGKMHEVSTTSGRTILFVSHNMQAVTNLCNTSLWLEKGRVKQIGKAGAVVASYLSSVQRDKMKQSWQFAEEAPGNDFIRLKNISVKAQTTDYESLITVQTPVELEVEFWNYYNVGEIEVNISLFTISGECVFDLGSPTLKAEKGLLVFRSVIPGHLLNNHTYFVTLKIWRDYTEMICEFSECTSFKVEDISEGASYFGTWSGIIRPQIEMSLTLKKTKETFYS